MRNLFKLYRGTDWLKWLLPFFSFLFLALSWILAIYHQANSLGGIAKLIPSSDFFERFLMTLSGMFLSAWLVKYVVEDSIKIKENKKVRLITYHYIYCHLSLIARNAFYFIIFSGKRPKYPHPELSHYSNLAGMSNAVMGGLCEIDVDNDIKYLAEKLDAKFHEALRAEIKMYWRICLRIFSTFMSR